MKQKINTISQVLNYQSWFNGMQLNILLVLFVVRRKFLMHAQFTRSEKKRTVSYFFIVWTHEKSRICLEEFVKLRAPTLLPLVFVLFSFFFARHYINNAFAPFGRHNTKQTKTVIKLTVFFGMIFATINGNRVELMMWHSFHKIQQVFSNLTRNNAFSKPRYPLFL